MLDRHNAFRRAHGVPALTLDPKVQNLDFFNITPTEYIQIYFDICAKNPIFRKKNESELPSLVQIKEVEKHIGIDQIFLAIHIHQHMTNNS